MLRRLICRIKRRYDRRKFWKEHPHLLCDNVDVIYNNIIDRGFGNKIVVEKNAGLSNCNITFNGTNCILVVRSNIRNVSFWFEDNGGLISIDSDTTFENGCELASVEGAKIIIGSNCMFSHDIDIRTTDSHSILNEKGERINPSEDIFIGNHVWVGIRSTVLKGAKIADNCIVGACSLVTSKTQAHENCIIAGIPAKIIKRQIDWDRKRI